MHAGVRMGVVSVEATSNCTCTTNERANACAAWTMHAAATAGRPAHAASEGDGDRPEHAHAVQLLAANGAGMAVAPSALRCSQARIGRRGAYPN